MNIIDFIPTGRENAVGRTYLMRVTGLPDRQVRRAIADARKDACILSLQDGTGYFVPADDEAELVKAWIAQETSRASEVFRSQAGAKRWMLQNEIQTIGLEELRENGGN